MSVLTYLTKGNHPHIQTELHTIDGNIFMYWIERDYELLIVTISNRDLQIKNQNLMLENTGSPFGSSQQKGRHQVFKRNMDQIKDEPLKKLSMDLQAERSNIWKSSAKKWIKKDLLEESLSKCFWFHRAEKNTVHPTCIAVRHTHDQVVWLVGEELYSTCSE